MNYSKAIYALKLYGIDGELIQVSTESVEIDGEAYTPSIASFSVSKSIIDPEQGTSSQQKIDVSFFVDTQKGSRKIGIFDKCEVFEVRIINMHPETDESIPIRERVFVSSSKVVSVRKNPLYDIYVYDGNITDQKVDRRTISLSISLLEDQSIGGKLPEFNKQTYGMFFAFNGTVNLVETKVLIPDMSPNSGFPIGRLFTDTVDRFSYYGGATMQYDPTLVDIEVSDAQVDINSINVSGYSRSSPAAFVVRADDYFNSVRQQNAFAGRDRVPFGRVAAVSRYDASNDGHSGVQITLTFDEHSDTTTYTGTNPLEHYSYSGRADYEYSNTRYGAFILMRIPKGTKGTGTFDFQSIVQQMEGRYKIAPYVFLYDRVNIRIDDSAGFGDITTTSLEGAPPDAIFAQLNNISSANKDTYVWLDVFKALDLRADFRERWGGLIMRNGLVNAGIVEHSDGAGGGIRLLVEDEPGRAGEAIALFDPEILHEDGGHRYLEPDEWLLVQVPAYEVIKRLSVPADAFGEIDPRALINTRIDAIRLDETSTAIVNMQTPYGTMSEIDVKYEDVLAANSGMFAYIESITKLLGNNGEMEYLITLKSPELGDPKVGNPSIPNTMSRVTSDPFNRYLFAAKFKTPPENSGDEGNIIPLVYGYVEKAPLIHAISKKATNDPSGYAGDDIYIMCCHPVAQKDHNSVTVWWGLDQIEQGTSPLIDPNVQTGVVENQFDKAKPFWIPNPFPAYGKILVDSYVDIELPSGQTAQIFQQEHLLVPNPLHLLVSVESNDGDLHTGIRLRGDEVSKKAPEGDVRFNIRNGLGNTKLYASFAGIPDDSFGTYTGVAYSPIIHPAHIIKHLLVNFAGVSPTDEKLNNSIDLAYSMTTDYQLGIRLDEDKKLSEIFTEIALETMIYVAHDMGQYIVGYLDLNPRRVPKINLTEGTEILVFSTTRYFNGATEITLQYGKKHAGSKGYTKSMTIGTSNRYLRKAARIQRDSKPVTIKLDYVYSDATARAILQDKARLLGGVRTLANATIVRNVYTDEISLFDVVGVSSADAFNYATGDYGFVSTRFIVIGIETFSNERRLTLLQLV